MVRRFRYYSTPEEIKEYLARLGYSTEDHHYTDDEKQVTGFSVNGMDVSLSYDIVIQHPTTDDLVTAGYGMIGLDTNPFHPGYTPEKAQESLNLYNKLYRRFRKPSRSQ